MTGLDLYLVFVEVIAATELVIERYTTLLFGFLVASYLISAKLDKVMVAIVLSLYSVMALRYSFLFVNTSDDVIAMAGELREMAASPDSNISWLEIGPVHIVFYGVFVVMILSYLASLVFFYRTRQSPRNTEETSRLLD